MSTPNPDHLKMIQDAITRMANNSFSYKAWSVVVATGVAAVYASNDKPEMFLIGVPAALLFWWLDAFHLTVERRFRRLYEKALKGEVEEFEMKPDVGNKPLMEWIGQFWSKTLLPFHLVIVAFLLIGFFVGNGL
jgi:hypothetical protein